MSILYIPPDLQLFSILSEVDYYSFKIEPTTGGSFFRMLTEDLLLDTGLLDTFLPLIQAHYLDFISRFEVDLSLIHI